MWIFSLLLTPGYRHRLQALWNRHYHCAVDNNTAGAVLFQTLFPCLIFSGKSNPIWVKFKETGVLPSSHLLNI